MAGRFYFLGSVGTTAGSLSFPAGDGNPDAITATTITLPTSASTVVSAFTGFTAFVYSGSGVGQRKQIASYSTARVATLSGEWEAPRPGTGSFIVYGPPMRHQDMAHYKVEYGGTATTGILRAHVFADAGADPRSIYSQSFVAQRVAATAAISSTAVAQGETVIIDLMPLDVVLAKIYIETAPTAGTLEIFVAPGKSYGRQG